MDAEREEEADAPCVRYHVCVRCNKRHTHKRFQNKRPHTDVPSDWQEVLGFYTNKHTGRPLTQKVIGEEEAVVMCHSCHKQYVNRCKRRPAPSSLESVATPEPKRHCRTRSELSFEHAVDLMLLISASSSPGQTPSQMLSDVDVTTPSSNDTIKKRSSRVS